MMALLSPLQLHRLQLDIGGIGSLISTGFVMVGVLVIFLKGSGAAGSPRCRPAAQEAEATELTGMDVVEILKLSAATGSNYCCGRQRDRRQFRWGRSTVSGLLL